MTEIRVGKSIRRRAHLAASALLGAGQFSPGRKPWVRRCAEAVSPARGDRSLEAQGLTPPSGLRAVTRFYFAGLAPWANLLRPSGPETRRAPYYADFGQEVLASVEAVDGLGYKDIRCTLEPDGNMIRFLQKTYLKSLRSLRRNSRPTKKYYSTSQMPEISAIAISILAFAHRSFPRPGKPSSGASCQKISIYQAQPHQSDSFRFQSSPLRPGSLHRRAGHRARWSWRWNGRPSSGRLRSGRRSSDSR